jgi:kynurenine formamidase
MGTDARGAGGVAALHFPGLDPEAARWLAEERKVHAVGIDTPSIDHGPSRDFAAHVALCAANVAIFENVASMSDLPARDFEVVALPMKIGSGSGAPLRSVAVIRRPPAER